MSNSSFSAKPEKDTYSLYSADWTKSSTMSELEQKLNNDLVWSVKNGDLQAIKNLLSGNPKKINEQISGRVLLHYAADYGQVEALKELIKSGANINETDKYGITPILAAIYEDHVDCVKYLIEQNADVKGTGPDGLPYEESSSNQEIRTLILKAKGQRK